MIAAAQRTPSREQAQSLVEFALVVPIFLLILFALIDFGRLEFSYISLANATREMARTASIPPTCSTPPTPCNANTPPSTGDVTTSSNAVDQSFLNYQGFVLSALSAATDSVTVTVSDRTCTALIAAGNGPCVSPHVPTTVTCTLPLVATTCAVPTRFGLSGGSVNVVATFQFTFSPLFQNRLSGMIDASFMQQFATLSTTTRAYIE